MDNDSRNTHTRIYSSILLPTNTHRQSLHSYSASIVCFMECNFGFSVEKSCKLRMNKVKCLVEDVEKRVGEVKGYIMNMSVISTNSSGSQHKVSSAL